MPTWLADACNLRFFTRNRNLTHDELDDGPVPDYLGVGLLVVEYDLQTLLLDLCEFLDVECNDLLGLRLDDGLVECGLPPRSRGCPGAPRLVCSRG